MTEENICVILLVKIGQKMYTLTLSASVFMTLNVCHQKTHQRSKGVSPNLKTLRHLLEDV